MAQVALAWSLSKPFVTAPIVGTTSINKLKDLAGTFEIERVACGTANFLSCSCCSPQTHSRGDRLYRRAVSTPTHRRTSVIDQTTYEMIVNHSLDASVSFALSTTWHNLSTVSSTQPAPASVEIHSSAGVWVPSHSSFALSKPKTWLVS